MITGKLQQEEDTRDTWNQKLSYIMLHTLWRLVIGIFDSGEGFYVEQKNYAPGLARFSSRPILTDTRICRRAICGYFF